MPVQYIIGEWDFRDITLKMEPPIFIPRPETETLVDVFLQKLDAKNGKSKVLEIGCGSGAICLSILHSRNDVSFSCAYIRKLTRVYMTFGKRILIGL